MLAELLAANRAVTSAAFVHARPACAWHPARPRLPSLARCAHAFPLFRVAVHYLPAVSIYLLKECRLCNVC